MLKIKKDKIKKRKNNNSQNIKDSNILSGQKVIKFIAKTLPNNPQPIIK